MSDFKIKVTADLDTSQVEAKLMALQNRKITIQANAILWILELVSYLSVLSWGISFQLVEKPAEIKLIIIPDDFRNFIDGIYEIDDEKIKKDYGELPPELVRNIKDELLDSD